MKIGIDLGGTKIEGILLDENNKSVKRLRVATDQHLGYKSILNRIVKICQELKEIAEIDCSIGIGTPGAISSKNGLLKNSNTQCLNGKPLKNDLESLLGQKISMENDANCFALAESILGAGKQAKLLFGIIMGTGVGGGIVMNHQIHRGPNHIAGEWGHNVLIADGKPCYCGKAGCIETYLSGPALELSFRNKIGDSLSLNEINKKLLNTNDPALLEWRAEARDLFARALAQVINILDPDIIVLGGGVSNVSIFDDIDQVFSKYVFSDNFRTPIVTNQMGDSAGVYGAALMR